MKKIVFIWIGESFPQWGFQAIDLALKYNQDIEIHLIISEILIKQGLQIDKEVVVKKVEDYYTSDKSLESLNLLGDIGFRDKFWLRTTERYLVLKNYMIQEKIHSCFHAELDNVIFNLDGLDSRLDQYGAGLFAPRESLERGVASFIYINNIGALEELCDGIYNSKNFLNDMYLMGDFLDRNPKGYSLPTENQFLNPEERGWRTVGIETTQGIFDAIAIGMYLLGVDWRNIPMQVKSNMYLYEFMAFDLRKCKFKFDKSRLFMESNGNSQRIFNLHVHSKQLHLFRDPKKINKIIEKINKNKKTIIGKRYNIFFAPLLFSYQKAIGNKNLKNLLRFFYYKFIVK